jgi:hypothetical protein
MDDEDEDEQQADLLAVEDPEEMKTRLAHELKKKVIEKQNKVPRHGKGKYDVTVPQLFEFQKNPREEKTLRQIWLEKEVERKERDL